MMGAFHARGTPLASTRETPRYDRKSTRVLAQVQLSGTGAPVAPFVGQILNLSASGLMLESDAPLDVNHEVSISFFVPGTQTRVTAAARVVRRVKGDGTPRWGVRFTILESAVRQAVNVYVAGQRPVAPPRPDVKPR